MNEQERPYLVIDTVLRHTEMIRAEQEEGKAPSFYIVPKNISALVGELKPLLNSTKSDPLLDKMAEALTDIIQISDRKHNAWDLGKQVLREYHERNKSCNR